MKNIQLNNGVQMSLLGYGVYQVDPEECERCVSDAISVGYRMIDTAQIYKFQLSAEDMSQIAALDTKQTLFSSHRDPDFVEMILQYGN